ncbi:hypothetical protein C798_01405 [Herbaspirillum rubrisubalbicans Os34]|uniref:Uncharacterized protein n=1 Tax=Herbaspirillum rubrisubalbicans Os34 TaxID=1235827 RepID=A0A6M3ZN63_9BURK|nr:hypothetical protein [Herbaspirillum rubrisubalbicans]QJP98931.1 hypothetical protein C798_01405 [Herbaspirillum rubrisubalbicans Os34]
MMNFFCHLVLVGALIFHETGLSKEREEINYSLSTYRQTGLKEPFNSLYIEKLVLRKSAAIGKTQVVKINRTLEARYASVYAEARSCHEPEFEHPWGYRFVHQKIHLAHGVLGIVFDFQAVCGGVPYFGKSVKNFAIRTGNAISSRQLVKRYAPSLLEAGAVAEGSLLILGEDAADILIEQNGPLLTPEMKDLCSFHFKTTAFHILIKNEGLFLMPLFQRPYSACQKEYPIRTEKSASTAIP